MLNSASPELLVAGIAFINSFVESAPCPQARLYVQAELEQAGYNPDLLAKVWMICILNFQNNLVEDMHSI